MTQVAFTVTIIVYHKKLVTLIICLLWVGNLIAHQCYDIVAQIAGVQQLVSEQIEHIALRWQICVIKWLMLTYCKHLHLAVAVEISHMIKFRLDAFFITLVGVYCREIKLPGANLRQST